MLKYVQNNKIKYEHIIVITLITILTVKICEYIKLVCYYLILLKYRKIMSPQSIKNTAKKIIA